MLSKLNVFFKKHRKAFTILFVLSLLPYLTVLLSGIDVGINGSEMMGGSVSSGLDNALSTILLTFVGFVFTGVFPVCWLYQILFLILHFKNK